ncbi:MAG: response regulator transcription factor [Lachnospiraceae bacterium]|jgi:DNA-binding NarL/FixJ family response regulator|nr:response regulator transcription factor [Lachnospiraceae bacterium]
MIRVMIVDDHKMVREGLTKLIELDEEIKVVAESNDGSDCMYKLRAAKPDVILLDINMPDMNGIETLKVLNKRKNRPKVLMLTVHNEIEYLTKLIDMGVEGYILKDSGSSELVRAIRSVYYGERFIQPSMIPLLNSKLIAKDIDKEKLESLSNRELEVLKLVSVGHFNKDIGRILCISERTVKNHLSNIFRKIDCTDRTQAAVFCIRNGVVSVHD